MTRKLVTKGELWIIIIVLILAAGIYAWLSMTSQEPVYAIVSVRNHPDTILDLSEDGEFVLPQNSNVKFRIENGAVAFIASDCPDQVCVHMGFLRRPGQSAACLPNFTSLVIMGPLEDWESDIVL